MWVMDTSQLLMKNEYLKHNYPKGLVPDNSHTSDIFIYNYLKFYRCSLWACFHCKNDNFFLLYFPLLQSYQSSLGGYFRSKVMHQVFSLNEEWAKNEFTTFQSDFQTANGFNKTHQTYFHVSSL